MKQNFEENAKKINSGQSVNLVTEYLQTPTLWHLDDPRYTWLDEKTRAYLDSHFDFDYGDILHAVKSYLTMSQVAQYLMTDDRKINSYCETLWHKPWDVIYRALSLKAKENAVDTIFMPWATQGNGVALSVMHKVTKPDLDDNSDKEIKIRLVNDIEEK